MTFSDALREVLNGETIYRQSWEVPSFVLLQDDILMIFIDHKIVNWTVSRVDLEATDWIISEK